MARKAQRYALNGQLDAEGVTPMVDLCRDCAPRYEGDLMDNFPPVTIYDDYECDGCGAHIYLVEI